MIIRSTLPVVSIISLRFLGLFVVLPVVSLYALELQGSNEFLVGIMIGAYALTQLLFQIPFGVLSDKIGRKKTLAIGLSVFALGSVVCGFADDIYILIFGRFLQGSGAIGAVGSAMISDMVKEEERGKAMAFMGASIALSFATSMMLGPLIGGHFGVEWLFFLTAFLALLALVVLFVKVESPPQITHDYDNKVGFFDIMRDGNLGKMNVTNFLQKGLMTLAFFIIPILVVNEFGWSKEELWKAYLPAMVCGLLAMGPAAVLGEKKGKSKFMLGVGVLLFLASYLILGYASSINLFVIGVVIFFIGFNIHEPLMQSMASKFAKVHQKGAALGLFNAFGYAGTFVGGVFGGYLLKEYGIKEISWVIVAVCLLWLLMLLSLHNPAIDKNIYLEKGEFKKESAEMLNTTNGVIEWYFRDETLVVKYNSKETSCEQLRSILEATCKT